ncbi:uncharacterized protein FIBRA_07523 [Fibroporia radiculosa]|uniref:Uncharacterized protein n=1 Tax=Fibroporia radiculosa TaxID=599839 RepID=J4H4N7_9APHY|nr:uncharacterized protein FIBRA_07523 [Fibroporia radiculosa]CCM05309.1 predicted protein [Fibroporia radiculosa]
MSRVRKAKDTGEDAKVMPSVLEPGNGGNINLDDLGLEKNRGVNVAQNRFDYDMGIVFRNDEAYLVAGWVESYLWGLYTIVFGITMYKIRLKGWKKMNKVTAGTIIVLYVLATAHNAMALRLLINGFIVYVQDPGPQVYFANIVVPLNVAKDVVYVTNIWVGDSVIVWRLYVIWGKKLWIAAFPVCMMIATAITGYYAIGRWLNPALDSTHLNLAFYETSFHWVTAMYAVSLCTNVSVTIVTATRIWWVGHRNTKILGSDTHSPYSRVILLLLESGSVLSAAKTIEFALFETSGNGYGGDNSVWIVIESMPQIMGIMPTLVILAVNAGFTRRDDFYSLAPQTHTVQFASQPPNTNPTMGTLSISERRESNDASVAHSFYEPSSKTFADDKSGGQMSEHSA